MKNREIIIILWWTWFVWRAITEKFLDSWFFVIIFSKQVNRIKCKEKLLSHSFEEKKLEKYIEEKKLFFAYNIDFSTNKVLNFEFEEFLKENNLNCLNIAWIINLISETSWDKKEIISSNIWTINNILVFIKRLKKINEKILFINMWSVAERNKWYFLAPYEKTKKIIKGKVFNSWLCDYHLVASYIRWKWETKMKNASEKIFDKIKISKKWMYSNYISIIDVDELAKNLFNIIFDLKLLSWNKNIEINFTNWELSFWEIIETLVWKSSEKFYLNWVTETLFLKLNYFLIKIFFRNNQFLTRLWKIWYLSTKSYSFQKKYSSLLSVWTESDLNELEKNINFNKMNIWESIIYFSVKYLKIYYFNFKSKKDLKNIIKKSKYESNNNW